MRRLLTVVLCGMLAGCGYTTGSLLPSNIKTIAIEPFKNKVNFLNESVRGLYVPLLENRVYDTVVFRFQQDGNLKITKPETADLVLTADLTGFDREELRVNDDDNITEYRIRITVSFKVFDRTTNEEMLSEESFSGESTYQLTGPRARSETAALNDALTDLARRMVERTIENW